MLEANFSGFWSDDHFGPIGEEFPRIGPRFYNFDIGEVTGAPFVWWDASIFKTAIHAKVSHYAEDFLGGSYDFKFGVQWNRGGESYRCLDIFSEPGEESSRDPRSRFVDALKTVSDFVGAVERDSLSDAIERVEPWDPSFRDVTPDGSVSSNIAFTDDAVDAYRCAEGPAGEPARRRGGDAYGNFFGSAFRLELAGGEHPAPFLTVWGREESSWVIAFVVLDS